MRFITEDELRDIYRKTPFTTYEIEAGTRLTPGARQFLADRGMNMFDGNQFKNYSQKSAKDETQKQKSGCEVKPQKECLMRRKLLLRLDVLYAKTLKSLKEFECNFFMLQGLDQIAKKIIELKKYLNSAETAQGLQEKQMCTEDIEISSVHLQIPQSEMLFELNLLKSELLEMELEIIIAIEKNILTDVKVEVVENAFIYAENKIKELMIQIVGGSK